MSLILEALRKSEAERRRGEVPDLHAGPAPAALRVRDGPPAWLWLALALATAMILAMALWLARRTLPASPPAVDVPVAATSPAAAIPVDASGDPDPGAEPISAVGPSTGAVDRAGAAPMPVSMPLPGREAGFARVPPAASVAATSSTPPARASTAVQAAVPSAPAASRAPAPVGPLPAPAVAATPEPVTVATAMASTRQPATPVAAAPGSAPLRLSDLAAAQRQLLPPLKMSMHMWAPTQRFAIIDGARVSEGDRIGDAVVEEITVDGVVLAWQGQRLQIPTR